MESPIFANMGVGRSARSFWSNVVGTAGVRLIGMKANMVLEKINI